MAKKTIHYFSSDPIAREAIDFLASFPGNGGKECFGVDVCQLSGALRVFFDPVQYKRRHEGRSPGMTIDAMWGAARAWARIYHKR